MSLLHRLISTYQVFFSKLGRHWRLNESRANSIDLDVALRKFLGQGLGQPNDPRLGRTVVCLTDISNLPHDGSNVDNATCLALGSSLYNK